MDALIHLCGEYGELVLAVLGVFAAIATFIPAPKEDSGKFYRFIYTVLSWLACNVGKAKNAATTKPAESVTQKLIEAGVQTVASAAATKVAEKVGKE